MQLIDLVADLAATPGLGGPDYRSAPADTPIEIVDVVHDSRQAVSACLFCAVSGQRVDGHGFARAAVANGASALLVERWVDTECPQVRVASVRRAMPIAASIVHGHPSRELAVFGITGTNGKTTTTQLLAAVLRASGLATEVVGTLAGAHTTPEGTDFQRLLRSAADAGVDVLAAEVSSHALEQHRIDGTSFAVAAFSNLSEDHLDYHQDMQRYFEAKRRLFDGRAEIELINIDDPWGARLAAERVDAIRVSLDDIVIVASTMGGTEFIWRTQQCFVPLPGRMNVANAVMALEAALLLGADAHTSAEALAAAGGVPGRMQVVETGLVDAPTIVVDYSHTPASLKAALETTRDLGGGGSVLVVFGCGGDRDRSKRPLMGAAAESAADRVFVTSDNPRSEDPMAIIEDALAGMAHPEAAVVDVDRRSAIAKAIATADPSDVVLIAGKGHEKTQTIGDSVLAFDDVAAAFALAHEAFV